MHASMIHETNRQGGGPIIPQTDRTLTGQHQGVLQQSDGQPAHQEPSSCHLEPVACCWSHHGDAAALPHHPLYSESSRQAEECLCKLQPFSFFFKYQTYWETETVGNMRERERERGRERHTHTHARMHAHTSLSHTHKHSHRERKTSLSKPSPVWNSFPNILLINHFVPSRSFLSLMWFIKNLYFYSNKEQTEKKIFTRSWCINKGTSKKVINSFIFFNRKNMHEKEK